MDKVTIGSGNFNSILGAIVNIESTSELAGSLFCCKLNDGYKIPANTVVKGIVVCKGDVALSSRVSILGVFSNNLCTDESCNIGKFLITGSLRAKSELNFSEGWIGDEVTLEEKTNGKILIAPKEQDFVLPRDSYVKVIISEGNISISAKSSADYVVGKEIVLEDGSRVLKWINAEGNMSIGDDCIVNQIFANGNISIGNNIRVNDWSIISSLGRISINGSALQLHGLLVNEDNKFFLSKGKKIKLNDGKGGDGKGELVTSALDYQLLKIINKVAPEVLEKKII